MYIPPIVSDFNLAARRPNISLGQDVHTQLWRAHASWFQEASALGQLTRWATSRHEVGAAETWGHHLPTPLHPRAQVFLVVMQSLGDWGYGQTKANF